MNLYNPDTWLLIAVIASPLGLVAAILMMKFGDFLEADRERRNGG